MPADDELELLCRREYPRLVGALSLYCGDDQVARELAQEALWRACRHWGRLRSMRVPGAWLHRVALNLANSHHRRRAAERRAYLRSGPDRPAASTGGDRADALAVRAAVAALPHRQRAAVVLRYYLDWTVEEVAAHLGRSRGAVAQLTHRGLNTLRARLTLDIDAEEASDVS